MRLLSTAILSAAAVLGLAAPGTAADDDAKAVVDKAIKAHGGLELLAKYQAGQMKNKGKLEVPGVGQSDFSQEVAYMMPDKLKETLELEIMGQKIAIATVVNGDRMSIQVNGQDIPNADAIKAAIKDAGHMMKVARLYPLVRDKAYEVSLVGDAKVEDVEAVGVRVAKKDEKDINLFFDKKTWLLIKVEYRTTDPNTGNEVNDERFLSDYQKGTEGVPMPKKVVVKRDGKKFLEAEVLEAKLLEKLDDSEFKK